MLDTDAVYLPDQDPPQSGIIPSVEPQFRIGDAFAFIQRERRATQLMEDLRRFRSLREDGEEAPELTSAVASLLVEPADAVSEEEYPEFRGISSIPGV